MTKREQAYLREIAKLQREGRMPTLEQVISAVAEARIKHGPALRKAQRERQSKISVN